MSIINCKFCGTNTPHTNKHYFTRIPHDEYSVKDYLLMYFKTPFLYKDPDTLKTCDAYHYILYPPHTSAEHGSYKVGFVNDWVFFDGKSAKEIIERFNLPFCTPFYIDKYSIIEPYINKIEAELKLKNNCYKHQISALVTEMLVNVGRQYEYSAQKTHTAFSVINNARIYMLNHIENDISIQDLAKRYNYSVSRFCVLYKKFFSSTPAEDLIKARIEKAITLLKYQNTSITETAELCGFSSIHYFSRKFKEKTGVSPSYYLNNGHITDKK